MPKQRTKRKAAPGNLTEATIGDVFETETTALPPLNRHRAKKRRSTRTQPQRADLPDNTIINSSNNNLPTSPSANDIAEALFAKLHSSGIHLVKDNNVMPTSEISAILNPSLQTGHASSTQSMQIPFITSIPPLTTVSNGNSDKHDSSLASFQLPLSSDPDVIPAEQFHSSSANVDTPYACHMLKHSIPIDFHVSCKLKDDVWADNYVNFAFLLPSNIEEDSSTLFENFNITISNRKNKRELQSIHQWMNAFDIFMSIYLGKSLNSALALVKYGYTIRGLCKSLGFQAAKTYDEKFRRRVARLPDEKISLLLNKYKCKRSVTLRELQSLLGLLNFACGVIVPGRAFLTMGHTSPHYRIKLNSEPRLDLKLWDLFIKDFNGKSCFLYNKWVSSDVLKLYSDAAGTHGGFAAVFGSKWFAGEWPQEIRNLPITIKELFPIVLAIDIWG
ncbi:unnamed protein product [Mytilus edulis]|uniref:Uncharacterized protein n=1 Tax=Mytilus edulis TaxID=6550 RepID=A0A8S3UUB8_MYTED|nr:unnamed protein product [Mytilus edulis]